MNRQEDSFLDDVRDAKPPLWPPADDWVNSERGLHVLERVLGNGRTAGARDRAEHRRAGWWAGPRLAFAVGGLAVVLVAVAVVLVLTGQGGGGAGQVASTEGSAQTLAQVTKLDAVADVMPLYRLALRRSADQEPGTGQPRSALDQAVAFGLVTRAEISDPAATRPMTQGEFAVLLVKAFSTILPPATFPAQAVDPQATPEEQTAIAALVVSGIILPQDGSFTAGRSLSKDMETRLLNRLQTAYQRL